MYKRILRCMLAACVAFTTLFAGVGGNTVSAAPKEQKDAKKESRAESRTDLKDKVYKDLPTKLDMTDIYADEEAFEADMKRLEELIPEIEKLKGKLNSVEGFLKDLEDPDIVEISQILNKASMYSECLNELDATDPWAGKVRARVDDLWQKVNLAYSFADPEIMDLPLKKRQEILSDERLAPYAYVMRQYTDPDYVCLSEEASTVNTLLHSAMNQQDIRNIFDYVELPRPTFEYPDGTEGVYSDEECARITESPEYDHEFRKEILSLRNSMRQPYANTYAALLEGAMRQNWADARIAKKDSTLEKALSDSDVDPEIYEKIIEFTHSLLPKIHEYYAARKELLGLDEMMTCDINLSVTDYNPKRVSYDEAMNLGRAGISVWGDEYLKTYDRIAESSHIDVYPSDTKRSGACERLDWNGTTPVIIYNFDGSESYISTLVHEMGHAVYAELSSENQNFYNINPEIFTHEVASTANEIMFQNYMIENAKTKDEKIYWLDSEIDLFLSTLHRQILYSEFEDYCYKIIEAGGSLNADDMSEKWLELFKQYYGDAMTVDDDYGIDWARIDHLYYNYYLYKYATSITYAASLCNRVEENGQKETDAYLDFLKAGKTADPASLLAIAGIDPMDDDTYSEAGKLIEGLIDEFIETTGAGKTAAGKKDDDKKTDEKKTDEKKTDEKKTEDKKTDDKKDSKKDASSIDTSKMSPWINSNIIGVVTDDVKAGIKDDFYLNVNHDYLRDTKLRPGHSAELPFLESEEIVKDRCTKILNDTSLKSRDAQMIQDFYGLYLDWDSRNKEGIKPLKKYVDALEKVSSIDEMTDFLLSDLNIEYGWQLMYVGVGIDYEDSGKYNVEIYPTSLSLGDPAEYDELTENGKGLKEYCEGEYKYMLERFGYSDDEIDGMLEDLFEFEKKAAGYEMTRLEENAADALEKQINPVTMSDLKKMSPDLPLPEYMEKLGYSKSKLINLQQPKWLKGLNDLYTQENLSGIKAYILLSTLGGSMDFLDEDAHRKEQELSNKFQGITESKTDEEEAYEMTMSMFSDNMSRIYIDKYLDEGIRDEITTLCKDAIDTYGEMLDTVDWLSEDTRKAAKKKLKAIKIHAVYPDKWEDDSMFSVTSKEDGGTYFQAVLDYSNAAEERQLSRINGEVDREIWGINILESNAFYSPVNNSINIVPGFFCDATYSSDMTTEEKYGALGTVIGHEISHAFDTNGAQYDENGNFANWWTDEDLEAFHKRADKLVAYYDSIVPLDDKTPYRGQLVQTEAIADMAGMKCMLKMAEKVDGFDYDKFFRTFASMWADIETIETVRNRIMTDVHPLRYLRPNVTVQQFEEFYRTYNVKEGDGMYLAPGERIAVW